MVDRCAGQRLVAWLREQGHDVTAAADLGPDPGDDSLLRIAAADPWTLAMMVVAPPRMDGVQLGLPGTAALATR